MTPPSANVVPPPPHTPTRTCSGYQYYYCIGSIPSLPTHDFLSRTSPLLCSIADMCMLVLHRCPKTDLMLICTNANAVSPCQYMHGLNIVHRYVEPKHIIVTTFNNFSSPHHMKLTGLDRPIMIEVSIVVYLYPIHS